MKLKSTTVSRFEGVKAYKSDGSFMFLSWADSAAAAAAAAAAIAATAAKKVGVQVLIV